MRQRTDCQDWIQIQVNRCKLGGLLLFLVGSSFRLMWFYRVLAVTPMSVCNLCWRLNLRYLPELLSHDLPTLFQGFSDSWLGGGNFNHFYWLLKWDHLIIKCTNANACPQNSMCWGFTCKKEDLVGMWLISLEPDVYGVSR